MQKKHYCQFYFLHNDKLIIKYEGNTAVGISGVVADKQEECWLSWFGVRPEYRRKGYASAMLDLQIQMMQAYGLKSVVYTQTLLQTKKRLHYI